MRNGMVCALGAAALALAPGLVLAADGQAPPTLTPAVANAVAAACPGTRAYADALVRGITGDDAAAAAPRFAACAKQIRLFENQWKGEVATLAFGAVELSQGLLAHDPVLLRHAVDATAALRSEIRLSDAQVRAWPVIPDAIDADTEAPIVVCAAGSIQLNAAYVNVAARAGIGWVRTARASDHCTAIASVHRRDLFAALPDPWIGGILRSAPSSGSGSNGEPPPLAKEPPR
jgi:hypothetical protein